MLKTAKKLIQLGLPIIPLCSHNHAYATPKHIQMCKCAGKLPLIKNWTLKTITTEEDLDNWHKQFKEFNIGLPLGNASGYCGIDIDGEQGELYLQQMSAGEIPDTWEFSTGAGRRLLYLIPTGTKTKKFKKADKDGGHQECALLCEGQQTVLPPSIHYTGKNYEWVDDHSPWDIDCAEAPKWLVDLIKIDERTSGVVDFNSNESAYVDPLSDLDAEFEQDLDFEDTTPPGLILSETTVKGQKGKTGHSITVTEELLTSPIQEGQRDNTMTAIVGHYCANRDLRRLGKDMILQVCQNHNLKYCNPPLEAISIEQKVNYFFEMEQMKEAKFKDNKKDKPQFEPSRMAEVVYARLKEEKLLLHFDQHSKMYYFTKPEKGPWQYCRNITIINKLIRKYIINPQYGHSSWDKQSYIDETRKALEEMFTDPFSIHDLFDIGAYANKLCQYIVVNNGMLDWKEGQIIPWDSNYHTTVSFDVNYNPTADCPRFEKYLKEWLPDPKTRALIQEYLGYCLIPNTKFRKALFLYGKGKNGKSMLLEFLQHFFGENKSALSYDGLFTRFGPANLKGKLINIFDDTTVSFAKDTGIAKNLIAGGTISAEFKGRDHFEFTNVARFIYSAQETPRTADHSDAWYDRWFFIQFPNKFRPSNQMKIAIETAMEEEKEGIFNWMVKGLKRLMENDSFTDSVEVVDSSVHYRQSNDVVASFIGNMCCNDVNRKPTPINTLYKLYTVWAEKEGNRSVSKKTFIERTLNLGYVKKSIIMDKQGTKACFEGLSIDTTSAAYTEDTLDYVLAMQSL